MVTGRSNGVEVMVQALAEYPGDERETIDGPAGHVLDGYWSPNAIHDDGSRFGSGKKLLKKAARRGQVIEVLKEADQRLAIRGRPWGGANAPVDKKPVQAVQAGALAAGAPVIRLITDEVGGTATGVRGQREEAP